MVHRATRPGRSFDAVLARRSRRMYFPRSRRFPRSAALAAVLFTVSLLAWGSPARACDICSPASPVPDQRGLEGGVQKMRSTAIMGDTTYYTYHFEPGCPEKVWRSLDVENGYLFTATGNSVEVWNANIDLDDPVKVADLCRPRLGTFPKSDNDFYWNEIDAPSGVDSVFAVAVNAMGMMVFDSSDKSTTKLVYQDDNQQGVGVFSTTINGRYYAFMAADTAGVLIYDMSAALALPSTPCHESSGQSDIECPGVYQGKLPRDGRADSLQGFGNYLVVIGGGVAEIWDVSNLTGAVRVMPGVKGRDAALWKVGSKYYLAAVTGIVNDHKTTIYDVSCIATRSCGAGPPVVGQPLDTFLGIGSGKVTVSEGPGGWYLYVGSIDVKTGVPQREYLFDMSNPAAPEDVTPHDDPAGYWGWYYWDNPTGFRYVAPYRGKFWKNHFYRAASSIFDAHVLIRDLPPTANFSWNPTTVYATQAVTFADSSAPLATSWAWNFGTGNASDTSTLKNPIFTFPTPGTYTVHLEACNANGCGTTSKTVTVLDPQPVVGSVSANVTQALQCSAVSFTANGTGGLPPLSFDWQIQDSNGQPVAGQVGSGNPFDWSVPQDLPQGKYRAQVAVSNTASTTPVTATSIYLDVQALPTLVLNSVAAGTSDLGRIQFAVDAVGATEWVWDFGDGTVETYTDPNVGPNPVHTYAQGFTDYTVKVTVSNCRDAALTASTTAHVDEVVNLTIQRFTAQVSCVLGLCSATVGVPIPFSLQLGTGVDPMLPGLKYEYDWRGDGSVVEITTTPVSSHTYATTGTVTPKVTVTLGSQTATASATTFQVAAAAPKSINISVFPSTVGVGQAATLTATATGCTPSASGWQWALDGGAASGLTTGATIQVKWSTAGGKTVTAQNSACSGASGTRRVTVSNPSSGPPPPPPPPSGGNNLTARFTVSPSQPLVGQQATFDGSSSGGAPTSYLWQFSDGGTGNTAKVTHTFAAPGTYEVTLSVSKSGNCGGPIAGICANSTKKSITVAGSGSGGGPSCPEGNLCLLDGRFQVSVDFINQHDNDIAGTGHPVSLSNETGLFWFFSKENIELIVKMIDGRDVNDHFWVFYGALTDVEYFIHVKDTETGEIAEYHNLPGSVCGVGDTVALPLSSGDGGQQAAGASAIEFRPLKTGVLTGDLGKTSASGVIGFDPGDPGGGGSPASACGDNADALCLLNNRFRVEVKWTNQHDNNATGVGKPITLPGGESGMFYFFTSNNVELVVKLIDGRDVTGKFWVFYGALTDLQYEITVTDTVTGVSKTYDNPPGNICGKADTEAL